MNEIAPGIFHWTAHYPAINARVSSYFIAPALVVIDPITPEGGWGELPARPEQILLTSGHHVRHSASCAATFGIPIRALPEAIARAGDEVKIEPFSHHDAEALGITAIHIGKLSDDECAYHIAHGGGAIAFADGLIRYGGVLGFVPDELIGDHPDEVKAGLKQAFRGLLELDFEHLLFAHGEPLLHHGKAALREFVESPVGHEDFGQSL